MFKNVKKTETLIPVELEEVLTANGCVYIVTELVKYIMLQKQQIPLSFDSLVKVAAQPQPQHKSLTAVKNLISVVKNVSNNLIEQFSIDGCNIKEIVVLIGATIFTPKLCIRIEVPSEMLNSNVHLDQYHNNRKPLLNVMKSIFQCSEFQDEMTAPIGLTNTFVIVQKKDSNEISEFFVPKPQFKLPPPRITTFHFTLNHNINNVPNCPCSNIVQVYSDPVAGEHIRYKADGVIRESNFCDPDATYEWYQSREVFKGFKLR